MITLSDSLKEKILVELRKGTKRDSEIGRQFGLSKTPIRRLRVQHDIPALPRNGPAPPDWKLIDPHLGKIPDTHIACMPGVKVGCGPIRHRRRKLGIPPVKDYRMWRKKKPGKQKPTLYSWERSAELREFIQEIERDR